MIMMPYNCSSHRCSSRAARTSGTSAGMTRAESITNMGQIPVLRADDKGECPAVRGRADPIPHLCSTAAVWTARPRLPQRPGRDLLRFQTLAPAWSL